MTTTKPTIWLMNHYAGTMWESCSGRHHWFAKKLKERGYTTAVFCANTCYGRIGTYFDLAKGAMKVVSSEDGVEYIFVDCANYEGNGVDRVRNMTTFQSNVKKALAKYAETHGRPDLILASSVHPLTLFAGETMARKWGIPCICEIRDLWPETFFYAGALKERSLIGMMLTAGEHWIYNHADALIFLKPGDPDYIREHRWDTENGGCIDYSRCFYINNGIDLAAFDNRVVHEITDDPELLSDKKLFVYAGTINTTNAVGNLIDAARLLKERSDIKILVYGSGRELESLRAIVAEEGLENIAFKGHVNRVKIPYILSRARASILNYSASGYNWARGNSSNKLFEYMAAGKPIISTVKMGYSPIEECACGVSLDAADAVNLAAAIEVISDLPESSYSVMCSNARKGALEYDFEVLTEKLEEVVGAVMTKEGKRA